MGRNARRRKRQTQRRPVTDSGPLFISDLYADIRHIAGPIVDDLVDTDQRAGARLLDASLYCLPLLRGLSALVEHFNRLAGLGGLDADIAGLFRQTADNIYEGIRACIFTPGPRVMDQSRFLMEVEFLLYDLTARPESLDEWRRAEPYRRNQVFGFGKLRSRRERDLGVEAGQVLPDRDEYSVHSALVHPRPARELTTPDETPEARRFHLTSDLADLFEHSIRVANVAVVAVETFLGDGRAQQEHPGLFANEEPVALAHDFIANWAARLPLQTPLRPPTVPVQRDDGAHFFTKVE